MAEHFVHFFQSLSASLPSWLLLLRACIGHGFLMTVGLNVLYAWPLPHSVLKVTRKLDILIILTGPALFFYAMDLGGSGQLTWTPRSLRFLLAPYVVMCWIAGFVIVPCAQILYWLRRE